MNQMFGVVAAAAFIAATLHGCGGGGGGTTTTTTTTPGFDGHPKCEKTNSCSPPAAGPAMADYLNANYKDFNEKTMSGSLGVYVTMQTAGDLHIYCDKPNGCFEGRADCILSVALYNSHIMLDGDKHGAHLKVFAGRTSGYVINTSLALARYNKCAYIFDGASSFKLNQGCGDAARGAQNCNNTEAAYYDICPSTGKRCTINDIEIQPNTNCESIAKSGSRKWPNTTGEAPCYFTGSSFDWPNIDEKYNLIHKMVENRIYNQNPNPGDCSNPEDQCKGHPPEGPDGACCKPWDGSSHPTCNPMSTECNRLAKWNEVVMDLRPMLEDLKNDPNPVIPAFVYAKGHKLDAARTRDTFKKTFGPMGDAPLILMDQTIDVTTGGGPFKFEGEDDSISV